MKEWVKLGLGIIAAVLTAYTTAQVQINSNSKDIQHLSVKINALNTPTTQEPFKAYGSLFSQNRQDLLELRKEITDWRRDDTAWKIEHERDHP